jgi:hypothetical protein
MKAPADPPRDPTDAYFVCLAAERLGLLAPARAEECLRMLEALPAGSESVEAILKAGFLTEVDLQAIRERVAHSDLFDRSLAPATEC